MRNVGAFVWLVVGTSLPIPLAAQVNWRSIQLAGYPLPSGRQEVVLTENSISVWTPLHGHAEVREVLRTATLADLDAGTVHVVAKAQGAAVYYYMEVHCRAGEYCVSEPRLRVNGAEQPNNAAPVSHLRFYFPERATADAAACDILSAMTGQSCQRTDHGGVRRSLDPVSGAATPPQSVPTRSEPSPTKRPPTAPPEQTRTPGEVKTSDWVDDWPAGGGKVIYVRNDGNEPITITEYVIYNCRNWPPGNCGHFVERVPVPPGGTVQLKVLPWPMRKGEPASFDYKYWARREP